MQVFGAMLAGQGKSFWDKALLAMRNARHLEAGGTDLFAQLRIPYNNIPLQAQVRCPPSCLA